MTLKIERMVRIPYREEGWKRGRLFRVRQHVEYEVVDDDDWTFVDPIDQYTRKMKASFAELVRVEAGISEQPTDVGTSEIDDQDSIEPDGDQDHWARDSESAEYD